MKTAQQKTLFNAFEASSVANGINEFPHKMKQARWSGASYRTAVEAKERRDLAARFEDDLMKPYQDTYRNQTPAILLAMGDKEALMKVIVKKLTLVENEQRLARYLLQSQSKGDKWLMQKWDAFKEEMTDEEIEHYQEWIDMFVDQKDLFN
jgi:hypothetical protein